MSICKKCLSTLPIQRESKIISCLEDKLVVEGVYKCWLCGFNNIIVEKELKYD